MGNHRPENECSFIHLSKLKLDIENLMNNESNENEKKIVIKLKTFLIENYFPLCIDPLFFFGLCNIFKSKKAFFFIKIISKVFKELNENNDFKKLVIKGIEINKEENKEVKEKIINELKNQEKLDSNKYLFEDHDFSYNNLFNLKLIYLILIFDFSFNTTKKFNMWEKFDCSKDNLKDIYSSNEEIKETLDYFKQETLTLNEKILSFNICFIYSLNFRLKIGKIGILYEISKKEEIKINFEDLKTNIFWQLFEEYNNKKEPELQYKTIILSRKITSKEKPSINLLEMINKKENIDPKYVFIYEVIFTNEKILNFKINLDNYKNISLDEFKIIINKKIKSINEKYPTTKKLTTYVQINKEFIEFCEANDNFLIKYFNKKENKNLIEQKIKENNQNNENNNEDIEINDDNKINDDKLDNNKINEDNKIVNNIKKTNIFKKENPNIIRERNNSNKRIIYYKADTFSIIGNDCKTNELKQKLNNVQIKNGNLLEKINQLENEIKKEKNKNNELEINLAKLIKELENQKKINKKYEDISKIDVKKSTIYETILKKDKEIENLKLKLSRFPFELNEGEKLMSVIFSSKEEDILYSIICKNTDKFSKIENIFLEKNIEYADIDYYFSHKNNNKIKRMKSLEENKIYNNDIITFNVDE